MGGGGAMELGSDVGERCDSAIFLMGECEEVV